MSLKTHSKLFLIESSGLLDTAGKMLQYLDAASDLTPEDRRFWMARISAWTDLALADQQAIAAAIETARRSQTVTIH